MNILQQLHFHYKLTGKKLFLVAIKNLMREGQSKRYPDCLGAKYISLSIYTPGSLKGLSYWNAIECYLIRNYHLTQD